MLQVLAAVLVEVHVRGRGAHRLDSIMAQRHELGALDARAITVRQRLEASASRASAYASRGTPIRSRCLKRG